MSTALSTLIANIAKAGYGYASGTATSGTTTTLLDTSSDSPLDTGDSATLFVNAWLHIQSDSAGTPLNVGETNRITTYAPSTGTLTVGRAFTNAVSNTQSYEIYMGLPPTTHGINKGITQYINDVLRRLYYHRQLLLTLVTDGDMETSGVTNWTASNSSLTKSTSTGVVLGKQALRVANSGASGYAQSASVNVEETQSYILTADVTVSSGTAVLELYDVTSSASIDTAECDEKQSRRVYLVANIPADCKQVAVRLKGTEASADAYWDNVTLLRTGATEFSLPSWFKDRDWLEKVVSWRALGGSSGGDDAALDSIERSPAVSVSVLEDRIGLTPFKAVLNEYPVTGAHLVAQCLSPYDELSADSDTTEADADWVKAWALVGIGQDKKDDALVKRWLPEAIALDKQFQAKWRGRRFSLES